MSDPRLDAIRQMQQMTQQASAGQPLVNKNPEVSFADTMRQYLNDANDLQIEAEEDIRKVIAGEDVDPHAVMVAVEKATMSFDLVMEIRNKMLEAYREIMKTQI